MVKQFLLGLDLAQNRMLWNTQNGSFSPSPIRCMRGGFLQYSLEGPSELLQGKVCSPSPHDWVPLEFLISRSCCCWASFPCSQWFPQRFLPKDFWSGKLGFSVFTCLSLQIWRQQFPLCVHTSLFILRRVGFFFRLFSLLFLRAKWQLSSFLHAKLETRNCPWIPLV